MEIKANPNRMEILRLRKRLALARRGHKLLKNKLDELMTRFTAAAKRLRGLRKQIEEHLAAYYDLYLVARGETSQKMLEAAVYATGASQSVQARTIRSINLMLPELQLTSGGYPHTYSLIATSGALDEAVDILAKLLPELVILSQQEKALEMLAFEICQTRRRVNALEYILIPALQTTISGITAKLAEMERSNITRLMKVKDILTAKA